MNDERKELDELNDERKELDELNDERKQLDELLRRAAALEAELRALAEMGRDDVELIAYLEQQLADKHAAAFWRGLKRK